MRVGAEPDGDAGAVSGRVDPRPGVTRQRWQRRSRCARRPTARPAAGRHRRRPAPGSSPPRARGPARCPGCGAPWPSRGVFGWWPTSQVTRLGVAAGRHRVPDRDPGVVDRAGDAPGAAQPRQRRHLAPCVPDHGGEVVASPGSCRRRRPVLVDAVGVGPDVTRQGRQDLGRGLMPTPSWPPAPAPPPTSGSPRRRRSEASAPTIRPVSLIAAGSATVPAGALSRVVLPACHLPADLVQAEALDSRTHDLAAAVHPARAHVDQPRGDPLRPCHRCHSTGCGVAGAVLGEARHQPVGADGERRCPARRRASAAAWGCRVPLLRAPPGTPPPCPARAGCRRTPRSARRGRRSRRHTGRRVQRVLRWRAADTGTGFMDSPAPRRCGPCPRSGYAAATAPAGRMGRPSDPVNPEPDQTDFILPVAFSGLVDQETTCPQRPYGARRRAAT